MLRTQAVQEPTKAVRASKRKRPEVNYYETESDMEEPEPSQSKKQKPARAARLPKRKVFPFLRLPPEIRNQIYELTLVDPKGIHLTARTIKYRRTIKRVLPGAISGRRFSYWKQRDSEESPELEVAPLAPGLLAVNKQIYSEGRLLLYGNDFHLADPLALHTFVSNLGPRAATYLKRITLIRWGRYPGQHKGYNHACFAALVSATNLERLSILANLCTRNAVGAARQIYRDGFPWLEAVGMAKGKVDAAVDIVDLCGDNFLRWYANNGSQTTAEMEKKNVESFKGELSKLLYAYMNRIRGYPEKRK